MSKIVVIGAGQAGFALVAKLRALGFDGELTLIGEESAPPYQRPPLSKAYLKGEMELERLFFRPESFYADNNITLVRSTAATELDVANKTVHAGDASFAYDQAAITTGAAPRRLPKAIGGDLGGVHVMRDLADADRLAPELGAGKRVLIVGGGYIGLEAAAVCRAAGADVTVLEVAPRILQRVAAPQTSDYFRDLHFSHGVEILEETGLERLTGETTVTGASLSDGRDIPVDIVIVGIGVGARSQIAEAAGLDVSHGITVNALGQTSEPSVWAAGDCTALPYRGASIRLESVQNAIDQAEAVAANMLGAAAEYTPKPWFWSDQYDVKLQIAGLNTGYDTVVTRGEGAARSHWYFAGETLLAVDAMNDPRAYMVGKRLIEAGKSPDQAAIADPETDLKALMRA